MSNGDAFLLSLYGGCLCSAKSVLTSGKAVLGSGLDKRARLWDVATGKVKKFPLTQQADIAHATFDSAGSRIAAASRHTVAIWNGASGRRDQTVAIWNDASGRQRTWPHDDAVYRTQFSVDGQRLVAFMFNRTELRNQERITDTYSNWKTEKRFVEQFALRVRARVWLWDLEQGRQVSRLALPDGQTNHLGFSTDLDRAVASLEVGGHGEARVWQLDPLKGPLVIHHNAPVRWAAFCPADQRIVTACEDRTARIWNANGQLLAQPLVHAGIVTHAEFSADGRFVLTASSDAATSLSPGAARVWDAATGLALAPPLAHRARVAHVAWTAGFGTDNHRIATAGWDHAAFIWDLAPEKRDIDQLHNLVEILSGATLTKSAALTPLDPDVFPKQWAALRARSPADFEPTGEQIRGWRHEQARTAEQDQNSLAALLHWGQLIAAAPRRADLYTRRGMAHARRQRWKEAAADLARGIVPGTDGWPARGRLGVALLNIGQVLRAEGELNRALERGAPLEVRFPRAVAAAALQRWDVAADDCAAVLAADDTDPQVWRLWVLVCERRGKGKRAAEVRKDLLNAAIRKNLLKSVVNPPSAELALQVALTCCLGPLEPDDAQRVLEMTQAAGKIHINATLARMVLGAALHRAGRFREAAAQLKDIDDPGAHLFRVLALHGLGQTDRARTELRAFTTARAAILAADPASTKERYIQAHLTLLHLHNEAKRTIGPIREARDGVDDIQAGAFHFVAAEDAAPADDNDVLRWIEANGKAEVLNQKEVRDVNRRIETVLKRKKDVTFCLLIGPDATRAGKAHLVFWRCGQLSILDLSATQARHLGMRRSAYRLVPLPDSAAPRGVPKVKITGLVIDNADRLTTHRPITGRLEYEVTGKALQPLRPCLGYAILTNPARLTLQSQATTGITSGKGTLRFEFVSLDKRYIGPMLVFLEMLEKSGPNQTTTPASNMLAAVVTFAYSDRSDPKSGE